MPDVPAHGLAHASVFIDRSALTNNLALAKSLAPGAKVLCMVKANAYGHGMLAVAEHLAPLSHYLGVARLSEALALREHGIDTPIVLFSHHFLPSDFKLAVKHDITPCLVSGALLAEQREHCERENLAYWLKLDTGMHRLGVASDSPSPASRSSLYAAINSPHCSAVITHFHSADEDLGSVEQQMQGFAGVMTLADANSQRMISVANSALLLQSQQAHTPSYSSFMQSHLDDYLAECDVLRPGLMLYGADPLYGNQQSNAQRPPQAARNQSLVAAMSFAAPVIDVRHLPTGASVGYGASWRAEKPSWIATVAAGYGDGYPRHAPSGTPVLINGVRCSLAGRVSMDSIGVDVSNLFTDGNGVQPGDTAILWGQELHVEEIAEWAATISYQLLTGISRRVEYIYC